MGAILANLLFLPLNLIYLVLFVLFGAVLIVLAFPSVFVTKHILGNPDSVGQTYFTYNWIYFTS